MEFLNFFSYVNYLHQEHIELKQKYLALASLVSQVLPGIKARLEAFEKQNETIVKKKNHPPEKRMICQYCGYKFDEQWKLETHLLKHEEAEKFHCNVCSKTFQTNWRLEKHLQNHNRINVRVCKYFKKGQFCPFEKLGCKFSHHSSKNENENKAEKISDDESKDENNLKDNTTTAGQNYENEVYHRNDNSDKDCQGCGQNPDEVVACVECGGRYCTECVIKDHMKNLHYCLNCEDNIV